MHTGIQIGANIDRESITAVADAAVKVFESGRSTGMDQDTIREVIQLMGKMGETHSCTVSGATIYGGDGPQGGSSPPQPSEPPQFGGSGGSAMRPPTWPV